MDGYDAWKTTPPPAEPSHDCRNTSCEECERCLDCHAHEFWCVEPASVTAGPEGDSP